MTDQVMVTMPGPRVMSADILNTSLVTSGVRQLDGQLPLAEDPTGSASQAVGNLNSSSDTLTSPMAPPGPSPNLQPALLSPPNQPEIGDEISELIIQKIKEELMKASNNMKLVVKRLRIKETEDVEVSSKDIFHSDPDTPAVTNTAKIRDNDELVRSKQLDIADRENVGDNKEMETIPQYDGGDDLKIVFCDIGNQEFTGPNCVKNKKIHLINYHFKRKIQWWIMSYLQIRT